MVLLSEIWFWNQCLFHKINNFVKETWDDEKNPYYKNNLGNRLLIQ